MTAAPPQDSRLPRTVLVVNDADYLNLASNPKEVALLGQRDALIVPYAANPEFFPQQVRRVRELLDEAGQLAPGALLIKSPYDSTTFSYADAAIEDFTNAKYNAVGRIAGLLGATRVSFVNATVERTDRSWSASLGAPAKFFTGEAKAKREVTQRIKKRITGEMTFAGGTADVVEARAFMQLTQLSSDPQLNSLVELRSGASPVESYKMTFSGAKEADANFSAALNLAGAGAIKNLKIGASFVQTVSTAREVEIELSITFPSSPRAFDAGSPRNAGR